MLQWRRTTMFSRAAGVRPNSLSTKSTFSSNTKSAVATRKTWNRHATTMTSSTHQWTSRVAQSPTMTPWRQRGRRVSSWRSVTSATHAERTCVRSSTTKTVWSVSFATNFRSKLNSHWRHKVKGTQQPVTSLKRLIRRHATTTCEWTPKRTPFVLVSATPSFWYRSFNPDRKCNVIKFIGGHDLQNRGFRFECRFERVQVSFH